MADNLFTLVRDFLFPPKKTVLAYLPALYRLERARFPGEVALNLHVVWSGWMSWPQICETLPSFAPNVPMFSYDSGGLELVTHTDPHVWVRRYNGSLATAPQPASQLSVECSLGPTLPQIGKH